MKISRDVESIHANGYMIFICGVVCDNPIRAMADKTEDQAEEVRLILKEAVNHTIRSKYDA